MEVKKFYRTQREVAAVINEVIDKYWTDEIDDIELEEIINKLYANNQGMIRKQDGYTTILKQKCGKKRLAVVTNIINIEEITTP